MPIRLDVRARVRARVKRPDVAAVLKYCERKIRHANKAEAERNIAMCRMKGHKKLYVYFCNVCCGWHLTSRRNA